MLSENLAKDRFGMAYLKAITAACRCNHVEYDVDLHSIDLEVVPGCGGDYSFDPKVGIQLKTTSNPDWTPKALRFPLPLKNYEDLRRPSVRKNILVVLVVPDLIERWLEIGADDTMLRHRAYFLDFSNFPSTASTTAVTVSVPRKNVFGPDALRSLLRAADQDIHLL